ncbi:carbohydrate binding domain-containing protein [Terrimicrobium sacchariphilum]|uniref:Carbohydrate binding domain-containing protein n=1 Tax=Terrimicrobium sacchariphilum TaxID=690879 RepID=A0A146GEB8_TERSA|nr:carbohydrate binding domain-containing protein [Terrimicrobium sacchariphilum]GAT35463.1 carbohydrate binding domain-containing protein [Terrimicrobium sacchariphilum]
MKPLIIGIFLASASFLPAQILPNPGFESGLEGWKTTEKTPITSISTAAARTGEHGLRVEDQSETDGARFFSDAFTVSPGQKVTISFWARSPHGDVVGVSLQPLGARSRPLMDEKGQPPLVIGIKMSADWKQYNASYTVPDEAESMVINIRSWSRSKGIVDLDDFDVTIE